MWPIRQRSPTRVESLGGGVEHAVVLDARAGTDDDLALVATQHGARPDRALGADRDRADDHRVGVDVGGRIDRRAPANRGRRWARRRRYTGAVVHAPDLVTMVRPGSETVRLRTMSRRIDIELTSSLDDGTWTWRAAGAKQPKGVLDGSILPAGAKVGDVLKVEVEQEIDGITVLNVVHGREKQDPKGLLELLPIEREFQPVVETRARRERGDRPIAATAATAAIGPVATARRAATAPAATGRAATVRLAATPRVATAEAGAAIAPGASGRGAGARRDGGRERRGPSFTPPPEVPQRPKPKRLRPGKTHRTAVLADLPAEQRPIAELALQGIGAVRTRLQRGEREGRRRRARRDARGVGHEDGRGAAPPPARRRVARPCRGRQGAGRRARPARPAQRRRRLRRPDRRPRRDHPRARRGAQGPAAPQAGAGAPACGSATSTPRSPSVV